MLNQRESDRRFRVYAEAPGLRPGIGPRVDPGCPRVRGGPWLPAWNRYQCSPRLSPAFQRLQLTYYELLQGVPSTFTCDAIPRPERESCLNLRIPAPACDGGQEEAYVLAKKAVRWRRGLVNAHQVSACETRGSLNDCNKQ